MNSKALMGGFALVAAAYIGVAFGSSFYAEKRYHETLQEVNDSLAQTSPDIRITDITYSRGLFDSTGRFVVEWNFRNSFMRQNLLGELPADFKGSTVRFIVDNQIRTGPWLGSKGFGLARIHSVANYDPQTVPEVLIQAFNGQNMVTSEVSIGYLKAVSFDIYGAPFAIEDEGENVDFRGFRAQLSSNFWNKKGDFTFNMPYLGIVSDFGASQFLIHNLTYTTQDAEHDNFMLWSISGRHESTLGQLKFVVNQIHLIELNQYHMVSDGKITRDVLAFDSQTSFKGIYQGYPFEGHINGQAEGIDVNFYKMIGEGLENVNEEDFKSFIMHAPFTKGTGQLTINGQIMNMHVSAGIRSSSPEELNMPAGMLILSKMYANLNVEIPPSFLTPGLIGHDAYQTVAMMIQERILVRQSNNTYASDISMEGGRITVNGHERRF